MFDAVRNNKKIVQVFLALIALPFAFWGVDSYVRSSGPGNSVATVGESKITQQQFHESWREQMDRARQQMGPNFRQDQFDTPETRTVDPFGAGIRRLARHGRGSREKAREDLTRERRRSDERIRTAREDARRQVASLDLGGVVSGLLDELARIRAGRTSGDLGNP